MSTENIVSGKKYRILTDAINKVYDRISFWCKASDVEFNSGSNAQTTLGSITGISDSLTSTSSTVAASAYAVKQLNDKITELSSDLSTIGSMSLVKSHEDTTNGSSTSASVNNHSFTPSKDGDYMIVIYAAGNNATVSVDCSTATLNTLINAKVRMSHLMVITAKLKTTDTLNMTIKNSGGNSGLRRSYYVYS